jgi:hypothetical protein
VSSFQPSDALREVLRRAYDAWDAEDWDAAAGRFEELVAAARSEDAPRSELAGWAFDLALVHKFRRDWPAARRHGLAAAELAPDGPDEPVWWNLGIAATALHDWPTARLAWTRYGVDLPPGDGPVDGAFGHTPVRITTATGTEVVWCRRVDPARAVVLNVPLPGSGRRCGEVVLHDGVPTGERVSGGRTYSVFDEIELWAPSDTPVHAVPLRVRQEDDVAALVDLGAADDVVVEAWDSVTPLCAACSAGRVDQDEPHEHDISGGRLEGGRTTVGVAAAREVTDALLRRWVEADPAARGAGTPEPVA